MDETKQLYYVISSIADQQGMTVMLQNNCIQSCQADAIAFNITLSSSCYAA